MIFAIWQIIFKMENITTFPSQSDYLICLVNHAWPNSLSFFKDLIYLISKTISICKWKLFKSSRHAYESMNWFCRSSIISSWYYELNDIIHIRCIYTCHIIYLKYILFGVVTFRYTHPYYYHKYLKYNSCYIF